MGWDFESSNTVKYFGTNLKKAKATHDAELARAKKAFAAKYPYAKLDEFEFGVNLTKAGKLGDPTTISYIADGVTELWDFTHTRYQFGWDITSAVFKYLYSVAL